MSEESEDFNPLQLAAEELDADIYLLSGQIDRSSASRLIDEYANAEGRTNCALILSTYGGDADAAFIIARFLKRSYKRFTLYVFGYCKSAGTLVALGADEIVMSAHAELGPLDVQLMKEDELGQLTSGLDIFQSLSIVSAQAFQIFETNFLKIKARSAGIITTKTAAEIATALATQLLAPISAQVDPLRLGEVQRAINIARKYGELLGASATTLESLINGYPTHSFVIDYEEAQKLFPNVRQPTENEQALELALRKDLGQEFGMECILEPHDDVVLGCLTQKADEKEIPNGDAIEEPEEKSKRARFSDGSADQEATRTSGHHDQPNEQVERVGASIERNGGTKTNHSQVLRK